MKRTRSVPLVALAAVVAAALIGVAGADAQAGALTRSVSVVVQGSGAGTVTSSPAGIDCPSICTGNFNALLFGKVTLFAKPAPGSRVAGWGYDCINAKNDVCELSMSSDRSVTVSF